MVFSAPLFLFFFLPLVLTLYAIAPRGARNALLVIASLGFYGWSEAEFVPLILASILLNYYVAVYISRFPGSRRAFALLIVGIAADLALLIYFKYSNFIVENLNVMLSAVNMSESRASFADVVLPLGISFFTFHKISYKVDVFRGVADAKKSMVDLALYILLFPQLIAGPIVRYNEIADEMDSQFRVLRLEECAAGIRIFVVGIAKKTLLANVCAGPADQIFALPPSDLNAGLAWLGITCYTLQIYYDFSGYSDMAIGLARMLGFHFPMNFNYPYYAISISDFWRRWHITLSRWFRDYVYIPLGGNVHAPWRTYLNLVIVFFLCGLWHGASWSFVVWGLYHGAFLVLERLGAVSAVLARAPRVARHMYVLLVVMVGWVLFRAETLHQAAAFLAAMFGQRHGAEIFASIYLRSHVVLALIVGCLGAVPLVPYLCAQLEQWRMTRRTGSWSLEIVFRTASLATTALLLLFSLGSIAAGTYSPFIYFRF
jgi:alginate O-acetyltransferase complex protein AlgI